MLDLFSVKKPFYPLVAFSSSIIILVFGMLFSKSLFSFAFIAALFLIYSCFGLFKGAWKVTLSMLVFGIVIGLIAFLSNRNINALWQTISRSLLLGICTIPMVTLPPANLTRCMNGLKFPRAVTLGMLVTLRFVPILATEIKRIWESMKIRGANVNWYRPSCIYRAFFIPLVMRIIGISDTLSLSLETRAFTLDTAPATIYGEVKITARDVIFLFLTVALCVVFGVIVWKH